MSKATSKSKNPWIFVIKNEDGHLVPYANYDRDMFEELPFNKVLRVNLAQQRSAPRHRLYRVVLRLVVKNTDLFVSEDSLHKTLLLGCGVVEPIMTTAGEIIMIPSSTAFDAMNEETFKAYFDKAMEIIETNIIPGVDLSLLLKEARAEANYKEEKEAA
ncbi:hypothetical protein [Bradyrhizobium erythrophlei]|uniref:Uncharacterized protein n=1 Tax=Bradyrhizobium erythrophlei TaxID=1437360 RepID=A0A1M5PNP7_9BRAD|nr:hypothetical protein [Bradyrhizobium erythrophlei]SHH03445.1 hypothetical protein SAMN05443248_3448 [Bradyrhizobium erythrophlei]